MAMPVVIGLTSETEDAIHTVWQNRCSLLAAAYIDAVLAVGAVPIIIPTTPNVNPSSLLTAIDGLLLTGGGDLDPALYGAQKHSATRRIRVDRDKFELALFRSARNMSMPILGICRGAQVMNVALGGTLVQHISEVVNHERHCPGLTEYGENEILVDSRSYLAKLIGSRATVTCHHHQSVDVVGAEARIAARATDGVVEAIELTHGPFALGAQWHLESGATSGPVLAAFVEAARDFRLRKLHR